MKTAIISCCVLLLLLDLCAVYWWAVLGEHLESTFISLYAFSRAYHIIDILVSILSEEIELNTSNKPSVRYFLIIWVKVWLFFPEYQICKKMLDSLKSTKDFKEDEDTMYNTWYDRIINFLINGKKS